MKKSALFRGVALGAGLALVVGLSACANKQDDRTNETTTAMESIAGLPDGFDLQAHRGGRGEYTEESAAAFRHALELGVTTLEFDIVMSKDGIPVVWHDPEVLPEKCRDTAPATHGDHMYPYVGKLIHQLNWAQLQTLRCDKKLDGFPEQKPVKDNTMIQLKDVFSIAKEYGADVYYNIETKVEAEKKDWSAEPEEFVKAILEAVRDAGVTDRVAIQSFDWRTFSIMAKEAPYIPTIMLWDDTTWVPNSPWTGDVDYAAVDGDIIAAAKQLNVNVLSPGYSTPYGMVPGQKDYKLVADKDFVKKAHDAGFRVVPWTINDEEVMEDQIDAGADGIITDYPTKLREVMEKKGMELPKSYVLKTDTPVVTTENKK
ncbi:MAG TPA: glycerophosphodiester phosphodiesterase [Corynebacteriales bacterium]|nr:glycerophosphodiester phosphodiesterase [Mycobacteriales bacterium]